MRLHVASAASAQHDSLSTGDAARTAEGRLSVSARLSARTRPYVLADAHSIEPSVHPTWRESTTEANLSERSRRSRKRCRSPTASSSGRRRQESRRLRGRRGFPASPRCTPGDDHRCRQRTTGDRTATDDDLRQTNAVQPSLTRCPGTSPNGTTSATLGSARFPAFDDASRRDYPRHSRTPTRVLCHGPCGNHGAATCDQGAVGQRRSERRAVDLSATATAPCNIGVPIWGGSERPRPRDLGRWLWDVDAVSFGQWVPMVAARNARSASVWLAKSNCW